MSALRIFITSVILCVTGFYVKKYFDEIEEQKSKAQRENQDIKEEDNAAESAESYYDDFEDESSSSTRSIEEELEVYTDIAASSHLVYEDEDAEKSPINALFHVLEQVLISDKVQEVITVLEEILFRTSNEEELIKIADHNKSPLISQCITHESDRVILEATKIIEKISLNKSGQESGNMYVPVLIQVANSRLIQSKKSNEVLKSLTNCIANFSSNYTPESESSYVSLFGTASSCSLTDSDDFFGYSLTKVVVSLSEQKLGQQLLLKSEMENTMEWVERLLEEKQGGKDVQLRCLYAINNMVNETNWTLRRQRSKRTIIEYAHDENCDREIAERSSDLLLNLNDD
ncbi:unnamed protein product [Oikopleura dioica]|uniref:Armadillo repeat-containing domain-containing protein n=1 Tax=Oikopleura dioica TaxID=34765 RepID=E4YIK6_OIKDI|nr:unnamed protein product [Oikopleura dioica]